jgi:putative transposase
MAESFFATLGYERPARPSLSTLSDARLAMFKFIEGFYNTERLHSALRHPSPITFQKSHQPSP